LQHTVRTSLAGLRGEIPVVRTVFPFPTGIFSAAFSPDGRIVALVGGELNTGQARLYEAATGKPIRPLLATPSRVAIVAFSQDGKTLLTVENTDVRFWDVATGKEPSPRLTHQDTNFTAFANGSMAS
jgi:WD40 repeat protein